MPWHCGMTADREQMGPFRMDLAMRTSVAG